MSAKETVAAGDCDGDCDCDGDGDGNGDGNSEGDSGQRRGRWRRDGDGHGGDCCRFLGVANLIEDRGKEANRQIKDVFRCTCTEYYLYE